MRNADCGLRIASIGGLGLAAVILGGCHQPYFMTEMDYTYHNDITKDMQQRSYDESLLPVSSPRSVREPRTNAGHWPLLLEDATRIALENNKQIALLGFQPGEAGTLIDLRLASFDTNFEMGGGWRRTDRQSRTAVESIGATFTEDLFGGAIGFGSTLTAGAATQDPATGLPNIASGLGTDLISLSKRNATGGLTRISYRVGYTRTEPASLFINADFNPSWNSELEFHIEQPLLQAAGVEFNRSPILIARANQEQAVQDFRTAVQTLLRDVEISYWQLYFSYQDLYSRETGMKQALATWQKERHRFEVGTGALPDVAQAREQYEFFRAARLEALDRTLQQERQLRELMGLAPDDDRQIVPDNDPTIAEFEPDWVIAVLESMDLRPVLHAQRFAIRAAELNLFQQKNGLRPELTLSSSWIISGLDNQFDQSIDRLTDNRFADWTLGIRYRQAVGERAAHATVRQAQLVLSRERAILRNLEHTVMHELYTTFQDIITSYDLIGVQKDRRQAATVQLRAREEFYRQGKTTIDVLLQAQTTFADALRDESAAIARYNQALISWEFAKGTILTTDNVLMVEEKHLGGHWNWCKGKVIGLKPGCTIKGDITPSDPFGPLYPIIHIPPPPMSRYQFPLRGRRSAFSIQHSAVSDQRSAFSGQQYSVNQYTANQYPTDRVSQPTQTFAPRSIPATVSQWPPAGQPIPRAAPRLDPQPMSVGPSQYPANLSPLPMTAPLKIQDRTTDRRGTRSSHPLW